jgi:transposase
LDFNLIRNKYFNIAIICQKHRIEIITLVGRYRQLEEEIEAMTEHLIERVGTSIKYEWLKTVPGLGDKTIVELLL